MNAAKARAIVQQTARLVKHFLNFSAPGLKLRFHGAQKQIPQRFPAFDFAQQHVFHRIADGQINVMLPREAAEGVRRGDAFGQQAAILAPDDTFAVPPVVAVRREQGHISVAICTQFR